MEIPSVVDSVGHSASGSQTLAAQEQKPEKSIRSEKEDYCEHDLPPEEQKSLFGNDKEIQIQNKGLDFVCQSNTESSRESESAFLTSNEAPMEARPPPPPSAEVHDADMVSYNSCCSDVVLPVSAPEGRSDHADQNITGQILSREPKGYVRSLESSLTLVAHPNGLDAAQNFPPIPRIVNHKQSSITFLAHTKSSDTEDQSLGNTGSENGEKKCVLLHDAVENDDYEDDVFNELPARGELFLNHGSSHSEMRGVGSVEANRNRGWEAEEEVCCPLLILCTSIQNTWFTKADYVILGRWLATPRCFKACEQQRW